MIFRTVLMWLGRKVFRMFRNRSRKNPGSGTPTS
ncbi:hypothetical protein H4W27_001227 [Nesterenkonia lutea]|uniref:Uncharacterized protein n=1 Tax=Nesterenkonia lutea TaxID=272919 RepID=A0ABR9JDU6_9MICC|nr:hypothetical protein [Nesterenkonia lutea]